MTLGSIKSRTELLLIAAGWLWTFALASFNRPAQAWHMAVAAAIGLALSLAFRRSVMGFFRADLANLGDRITDAYLWTIVAFGTGLIAAGYVLVGVSAH